MRRQKLTFDGRLVAHGYTIPRGWGGRNGMCIGHGYKAWEISPEGGVAFKEALERYLADLNTLQDNLQTSASPTLSETVRVRKGEGLRAQFVYEQRIREKGTKEYERIRHSELANTENAIRHITSDLEAVAVRVDNWKEQQLAYGGAETQERWLSRLLKKEGE